MIHGGAGTMSRESSTPEKYAEYKFALAQALRAGYQVLREGGEAMDAAVAAVTVMEGAHHTTFCDIRFSEFIAQIALSLTLAKELYSMWQGRQAVR